MISTVSGPATADPGIGTSPCCLFESRLPEPAAPGGVPWARAFGPPAGLFWTRGAEATLRRPGRPDVRLSGDPFRLLAGLLAEQPELVAAGYWGYELRRHCERLPARAPDDLGLPDCALFLFDPTVPPPGSNLELPPSTLHPPPCNYQLPTSNFQPGLQLSTSNFQLPTSNLQHECSVRRVLDYIAAGDCYQVNLSRRFCAPAPGDPRALYQRLCRVSPAPYAAYLDYGAFQVLSSSPELFLREENGWAETRPIKGTRPRGTDPYQDLRLARELEQSPKDRAELVMIVDLERNDLGQVCEYGSVHVPELRVLESYPQVHHLVATVRGRLRPEVGPLECLRALFPGGSITGAPKIRAMEIIDELEPVRRGVYTGAIGWVDGAGRGVWNIAIRTMVVAGGQAFFHAGGGIVADSCPAAEYEEVLAKAAGMRRALEPDA